MEPKRILVSSSELILGAAIKHFLDSEEDLEVIGIPDEDINGILRAVKQIRPDAVILAPVPPTGEVDGIHKLILQFRGLKVIVVSSDLDRLHIYQEREALLDNRSDLVEAVRSLWSPATT